MLMTLYEYRITNKLNYDQSLSLNNNLFENNKLRKIITTAYSTSRLRG